MGVRVLRGAAGGLCSFVAKRRRLGVGRVEARRGYFGAGSGEKQRRPQHCWKRGNRERDDRRARGVSDTGRRERGAAAAGLMARGFGQLSGPCAAAGWGRPG